jgi:hypothetical protein
MRDILRRAIRQAKVLPKLFLLGMEIILDCGCGNRCVVRNVLVWMGELWGGS